MADIAAAASTTKPRKPVASFMPPFEMPKFEIPNFEMPKFEMPNFDMPSMEMPAAFREMAEKGIAQAKENYDKVKGAAEQATELLEDTYSSASKGCADYGLKVIAHAKTNSNATFDFYSELFSAKSFAEVVEKSSAFVRSQFETMTEQAKDLAECAQKAATDTAEPLKESFTSFGKSS